MLWWCKLYYELNEIQRYKNNWNSINAHEVVMIKRFANIQFCDLCDQLKCSTSFRTFILRAQYRDFEIQRSIISCATIEFLLFLQRWIFFNSYYILRHWNSITYVMIINWTTNVTIALAKFEIRRLSSRSLYR